MPADHPENNGYAKVLDHDQPATVIDHEANTPKANDSEGKDAGKASAPRRKKMLLIAIAAVLAVVGAYFVWNAFRYEDTDDAQVDGHIMPLSARINGQVEKVNFIEGQIVHAGDVLVVIDPRDFQVAADQAVANLTNAEATSAGSHYNVPITSASAFSGLDSAQASVTNAQAGVAAAEHDLEADQAALLQAKANATKTDSDLARYTPLVQKEDISRQQYDGAVAAAEANRAGVESAEAVVGAAGQSLDQAHAKLLQAKADLRNAQTAPQQVSLMNSRAKGSGCSGPAEQGAIGASAAQLELHNHPVSRHRNRWQEERRSRPECERWAGTSRGCASGRHLGNGQL
jgi:membrane fusion protein, multidrug efflux system